MQKIKITKVEKKPTEKGGVLVAVWDTDGIRFSGFKKSLQAIEVGDTIEIEVEVKGEFNNITELKSISKGTGTAAAPIGQEPAKERRESIDQEVAIKEIGRQIAARVPVPETAIPVYWKWIAEKAHFTLSGKFYTAPGAEQPAPAPASDEIQWPTPDNAIPASESYQKATGKPLEPAPVKLITAAQLKELKEIQNTYKVKLTPYVRKVNSRVDSMNKLTEQEAEKVLTGLRADFVK